MLFDEPYYLAINEARWAALQRMMAVAEAAQGPIEDMLDLGCGPGWFAGRLSEAGRKVRGLEGRLNIVEEARRRAPLATFEHFDFDCAGIDALPAPADAVLCFGLLYHLENPVRTLRICRALAKRTLFLETMIIPEPGALGRLVPENPNDTQGLRSLALILSPDAIAHAARVAGFKHVYRVRPDLIAHDDFADTPTRRRRREVFVCSDASIDAPEFLPTNPAPLTRYDFTA